MILKIQGESHKIPPRVRSQKFKYRSLIAANKTINLEKPVRLVSDSK
jgi:hypothetical protein